MPWKENSSLPLQDMYDQVYSYLIRISKSPDTMLQILGQVIMAQGLSANVDTFAPRPNSSSPKLLAAILGLWHRSVTWIVTESHFLLEVGNEDEDIRIRHPSFVEFLLNRTRSREFFIDINEVRSRIRDAPAIIRRIFDNEGK